MNVSPHFNFSSLDFFANKDLAATYRPISGWMDFRINGAGENSDAQSDGQISHLALDIGGNYFSLDVESSSYCILVWLDLILGIQYTGFICAFLVGTLAKLVYFSGSKKLLLKNDQIQSSGKVSERSRSILQGKLHFAKFETSKIDDCIAFIKRKELGMSDFLCRIYTWVIFF